MCFGGQCGQWVEMVNTGHICLKAWFAAEFLSVSFCACVCLGRRDSHLCLLWIECVLTVHILASGKCTGARPRCNVYLEISWRRWELGLAMRCAIKTGGQQGGTLSHLILLHPFFAAYFILCYCRLQLQDCCASPWVCKPEKYFTNNPFLVQCWWGMLALGGAWAIGIMSLEFFLYARWSLPANTFDLAFATLWAGGGGVAILLKDFLDKLVDYMITVAYHFGVFMLLPYATAF